MKRRPQPRIRVKATDGKMGNISYIYNRPNGDWSCVLANGTPAGFEYAGVVNDQMGLRFALESAHSVDDALVLIRKAGSQRYKYEEAA